jgi:hypothetical protein
MNANATAENPRPKTGFRKKARAGRVLALSQFAAENFPVCVSQFQSAPRAIPREPGNYPSINAAAKPVKTAGTSLP